MKPIEDFLSGLYNRLTNPFVLSILLSWLAWNWKITLVLFWPASKVEGVIPKNKSITDFIGTNLNIYHSFLYPIFSGIAVTVFIYLGNIVLAGLQAWTQKYQDKWSIEVLKLSAIPISRYLTLRENYDSRQKSLEALISTESTVKKENTQLNTQLADLRRTQSELLEGNSLLRSKLDEIHDITFLDGEWRNNWGEGEEAYRHFEDVVIKDGKYFVRINNSLTHIFTITCFFRNPDTGQLFFIKDRFDMQETIRPNGQGSTELKLNPNLLTIFNNNNLLEGKENHVTSIRYTRL